MVWLWESSMESSFLASLMTHRSSCGLWVPHNICHNGDIRSLLTYQIVLILIRQLIQNFYCFQIHDLGKVRGIEVAPALGSFTVVHDPCLVMACWEGANGQTKYLWHISPWGIHLHNRILMVGVLLDGNVDTLVLLPLSGIQWWLQQLLAGLLISLKGQWYGVLTHQPMYQHLYKCCISHLA